MVTHTCSVCSSLSVNFLRKVDYKEPFLHHADVGELKACAEADPHCGICLLLWRTMDDLTRLDVSKPAIRDHLDEKYGLYGQFYDDFDFKFEAPDKPGGLPSYESAIKIEARFLTFNLGLSRPGIRVFAIDDKPAGKHFQERCTYVDQAPGLSMQLGKKWLNICREHHEKCRPISSNMPTRVIALGDPNSVSSMNRTRLVVTNGLREPYVALSYCWGRGATESLMLRDSNLESLQQGIDEEHLVKTYREAFQVARDLGFWYIWIDALCIIQGNKDDWEHESARMGEVYGNAALSIMASRSSDSTHGFIRNDFKPVVEACPFPYGKQDANGREIDGLFVCLDRDWFKTTIDPDPVETRGWCLQEAELSRRTLVYGSDGVSYQCRSADFYEDQIWKFKHKRDVEPREIIVPGQGNRDSVARLEILNHWYAEILPDYTARALTNPSDVFAAIASLAKMAKKTITGRYLAGLWESDLPRSLLWKPRYQTRWMVDPSRYETNLVALRRPAHSQAPSWSWAAVNGPIQHGWDNKKRWRPYPAMSRPEEILVRPAGTDYTRWTEQDDCDAHVLYMPRCELQMYGRVRRLRCTAIPQERLLEWYKERGWHANQRPDDLPPRARGTILFEPIVVDGDPLLESGCPFDRVVAFGIFDIAEERVEAFWALPATKHLGLILNRADDGSFSRLGIFHLLNNSWFEAGDEELVKLV